MLALAMDAARIAALLQPFLGGEPLSANLVAQLQAYLDLLLRWNARMNLTAVRDPEQIVVRHFGESLFAARVLENAGALAAPAELPITLADVGSGAGFPGIPVKLAVPAIHLTLIESQNKKATFLREVIRTLAIKDAEVFCGRAEQYGEVANVVTMRAAERFELVLEAAVSLVAPRGHLCLLVGAEQRDEAYSLTPKFSWKVESVSPCSEARLVIVGNRVG